MFGIKIVREDSLKTLLETVTVYQRQLEDIGWISLSSDPTNNHNKLISEGFDNMLKRCKIFYYNNPLIAHGVHLTTSFVYGEGITNPKANNESLQEIIDEFWKDPDNKVSLTGFQAQHLLSNKIQYEGNLFFLIFDDDKGSCRVRVLNVEEIVDVIKDPEDRQRTIFYKMRNVKRNYNFTSDSYDTSQSTFVYYPDVDNYTPGDYGVPADKLRDDARIMHVKINCDINDKFGVPEVYRAIDWVQAHKTMAGDLATLIKALSKFAWSKKVKGTSAQVNSIAGQMTTKTNLTNIRTAAGQTHISNEGIELEPVEIKSGGADINIKGMREMKLMNCAASGIFEHYYGDPSTGNLATAKSMELPMVKKFVIYQALWRAIYQKIFEYVLIRKHNVGLAPKGITVEYDEKHKRMNVDLGDSIIDIDFPPILEEDLAPLAAALKTAKETGLVSEEMAAQLFMLAANVDNIDEELKIIKKESEVRKQEEADKFDKELSARGSGFGGGNGPVPTKEAGGGCGCPKHDNLAEAIAVPDKSSRFIRKGNYVMQRMNGYRKSLSSAFKTMQKEIINGAVASGSDGKIVGNIKGLDKSLKKFQASMKESAKEYFPIAIDIGTKYAQSHIPKDKIKDSLFEAKGKKPTLLAEVLAWNNGYIDDSLIPDMDKRISGAMKSTYETEAEFAAAVAESVAVFESRVTQYVGAFWTVEEKAVKEAGAGSGVEVNFVGADDGSTCPGCEDGMNGNPWPIDEAPEPGTLECRGNCRHALQIV